MRSIIGIVFILFNVTVGYSSNDENPPYLYYFSDTTQAFVIERADGSSPRILTHVDKLSDKHVIAGSGWSESGDWFAWYSTIPGMISSRSSAKVVRVDDERHNVVRENCGVSSMEWSSSKDILLIGCFDDLSVQRNFIYLVFDANQQEVVFTVDAANLGLSGDISDITHAEWTPNGEFLAVYYAASGNSNETNYLMKVFALDGSQIAERKFYTEHLTISQPYWSNNGDIIYLTAPGELAVENLQHDTLTMFESPINQIGWVDWSPDSHYAFIYAGTISAFINSGSVNPVWLLAVPEESLTLLTETSKPMHLLRQAERFYITTTWSLSGNVGYIVDSQNNLFLVFADTSETVLLHAVDNLDYAIYPQFGRWDSSGKRLLVVDYSLESYQGTFNIYDVKSKQLLSKVDAHITSDNFTFSPSGRYLAYSSSDCNGVCALDILSSEIHQLPYLYPPERMGSALELLWHPESDWLIVLGNPDGASRWLDVTNVYGTINRSIGECAVTLACFGWMPR